MYPLLYSVELSYACGVQTSDIVWTAVFLNIGMGFVHKWSLHKAEACLS